MDTTHPHLPRRPHTAFSSTLHGPGPEKGAPWLPAPGTPSPPLPSAGSAPQGCSLCQDTILLFFPSKGWEHLQAAFSFQSVLSPAQALSVVPQKTRKCPHGATVRALSGLCPWDAAAGKPHGALSSEHLLRKGKHFLSQEGKLRQAGGGDSPAAGSPLLHRPVQHSFPPPPTSLTTLHAVSP